MSPGSMGLDIPQATLETYVRIAERLALDLQDGDVILLDGDLGAGKTAFTQILASSLGIKDPITSPTFTLMESYRNEDCLLFHFDLYRLTSLDDLESIGFWDYVDESTPRISIVEWASLFADSMPDDALHIYIKGTDDASRHVSISASGPRSEILLQNLFSCEAIYE